MAYAGLPPASFTNNLTNVQLIDDISSSFNGSTQTFALTTNSSPFHAVSARSLLVTLGGVTQKPQVDYTVDGTNITFTTAPVNGLTFSARNIYGLNYLNNVNDGVITPSKLSTGGLYWNTSGNVGIGTTNTGTKLDIYRVGSGVAGRFGKETIYGEFQVDGQRIGIQGTRSSDSAKSGFFVENPSSTGTSNFEATTILTTGQERLRITSTGNVGIGTTDPSEKLEVSGNLKISSDGVGASATSHDLLFYGTSSGSVQKNQALMRSSPWPTNTNAGQLEFYTNSSVNVVTQRVVIDGVGSVLPATDATQDFGASNKRWANVYSADLQLSNEGSTNDVDGTWGQYTIQEGEEDLFLINRRNGKKYKFVLQEVN